ncbi:MAG: hypothetical protein KME06_18890 [Kastovskya adunca ATA6-11-RM4]|jgi:hypothetical protein|nr:hypothetical protein [Kastovskya adunca ATA6-11-RM4]
MSRDILSEGHQTTPRVNLNQPGRSTQQGQEMIYQFLLNLVRKEPPETVLLEFKYLFITYESHAGNLEVIQYLAEILFVNDEEEFRNVLKRSCYILINNWETSRSHDKIKDLVKLFPEEKIKKKSLSLTINRLRHWLYNFVESQDFQELKLFVAKHDQTHWSSRYTSYLLVPQYTDHNNSAEQREAARALSKKLKDQFKFELAMYTARSQSAVHQSQVPKNPTALGDSVLQFIKRIVAKRGSFSYANLANIFLKQVYQVSYKHFKFCLQRYLIFSVAHKENVEVLNQQLSEKLQNLYEIYHEETLNDALLLRTCNRVIESLTIENRQDPSSLFILLMYQGNPLTLVIVLLKVILICPNARTHLEICIADLIQYYMKYPEEECKWVVNFFEIFNITFAIYADNVQYNLIKMDLQTPDLQVLEDDSDTAWDAYRVFSQLRYTVSLEDMEDTLDYQLDSEDTEK